MVPTIEQCVDAFTGNDAKKLEDRLYAYVVDRLIDDSTEHSVDDVDTESRFDWVIPRVIDDLYFAVFDRLEKTEPELDEDGLYERVTSVIERFVVAKKDDIVSDVDDSFRR